MIDEKSSKASDRAVDDRLYPKYREALSSGDEQRASELLQVICARNPKDAEAKAELRRLEARLKGGKVDASEGAGSKTTVPNAAERKAAKDRLYPEYQAALESGDKQRAFELLQVICARNPKDAGSRAELGRLEGELRGGKGTRMAEAAVVPLKEAGSAPATPARPKLVTGSVASVAATAPPPRQGGASPGVALPSKKRNPWPMIVGASAGIGAVVAVLVMMGGGEKAMPAAAQSGATMTPAQEELAGKLDVLRVPDAAKIAVRIDDGDAGKWKGYFGGLRKWAGSPTWEALAANEFGVQVVTSGPEGAPVWLNELTGGGHADRGMTGLARLAREADGKSLSAGQWKRFDRIAGYLKYNKIFESWETQPFPKLAGRALRQNFSREPVDEGELKVIFALRLWSKDGFPPVLKSEVNRALKIAGSLDDLCAIVDALRSRSMKVFGSAFQERVEFYSRHCIYWLERSGVPKEEQIDKLKRCLADLDGYGETPEVLRNAIEAKLEALEGASASPGGDSVVGDPGDGDESSYSGPRCVRRMVKYDDLVKGKVSIPLLAHLVETRKKKAKEGSSLMWVNLKGDGSALVRLDGRKIETLSENKSFERVFWLGGVTGGLGASLDGTIRCRAGKRAKGCRFIEIRCDGASEFVVVDGGPPRPGVDDKPAWGEASFVFKENGQDLEISGEFLDWLKEAELPVKPGFYLKKPDGGRGKIEFSFGPDKFGVMRVAWAEFFPEKMEAVELVAGTSEESFSRVIVGHMEHCKAIDERIYKEGIKRRPYFRRMLAIEVHKLYGYIATNLRDRDKWFGSFLRTAEGRKFKSIKKFGNFEDSRNIPAFREFTAWLAGLLSIDPEEEYQMQREKSLQSVRKVKAVEVWSGDPQKGGVFLFRGLSSGIETDPDNE